MAGLSATPGRGVDQASENRRLAEAFGGRLITPVGAGGVIDRLQQEGVLASLRRKEIETGLGVEPNEHDLESVRLGFDYGSSVLRVLASDQDLMLQTVEEEVAEGRPRMIFSCTVDHAPLLAAALNLRGVRSSYVHGQVDRTDRQYAVSRFRDGTVDAITNFGVLTTGFDAPRTRTVSRGPAYDIGHSIRANGGSSAPRPEDGRRSRSSGSRREGQSQEIWRSIRVSRL